MIPCAMLATKKDGPNWNLPKNSGLPRIPYDIGKAGSILLPDCGAASVIFLV